MSNSHISVMTCILLSGLHVEVPDCDLEAGTNQREPVSIRLGALRRLGRDGAEEAFLRAP